MNADILLKVLAKKLLNIYASYKSSQPTLVLRKKSKTKRDQERSLKKHFYDENPGTSKCSYKSASTTLGNDYSTEICVENIYTLKDSTNFVTSRENTILWTRSTETNVIKSERYFAASSFFSEFKNYENRESSIAATFSDKSGYCYPNDVTCAYNNFSYGCTAHRCCPTKEDRKEIIIFTKDKRTALGNINKFRTRDLFRKSHKHSLSTRSKTRSRHSRRTRGKVVSTSFSRVRFSDFRETCTEPIPLSTKTVETCVSISTYDVHVAPPNLAYVNNFSPYAQSRGKYSTFQPTPYRPVPFGKLFGPETLPLETPFEQGAQNYRPPNNQPTYYPNQFPCEFPTGVGNAGDLRISSSSKWKTPCRVTQTSYLNLSTSAPCQVSMSELGTTYSREDNVQEVASSGQNDIYGVLEDIQGKLSQEAKLHHQNIEGILDELEKQSCEIGEMRRFVVGIITGPKQPLPPVEKRGSFFQKVKFGKTSEKPIRASHPLANVKVYCSNHELNARGFTPDAGGFASDSSNRPRPDAQCPDIQYPTTDNKPISRCPTSQLPTSQCPNVQSPINQSPIRQTPTGQCPKNHQYPTAQSNRCPESMPSNKCLFPEGCYPSAPDQLDPSNRPSCMKVCLDRPPSRILRSCIRKNKCCGCLHLWGCCRIRCCPCCDCCFLLDRDCCNCKCECCPFCDCCGRMCCDWSCCGIQNCCACGWCTCDHCGCGCDILTCCGPQDRPPCMPYPLKSYPCRVEQPGCWGFNCYCPECCGRCCGNCSKCDICKCNCGCCNCDFCDFCCPCCRSNCCPCAKRPPVECYTHTCHVEPCYGVCPERGPERGLTAKCRNYMALDPTPAIPYGPQSLVCGPSPCSPPPCSAQPYTSPALSPPKAPGNQSSMSCNQRIGFLQGASQTSCTQTAPPRTTSSRTSCECAAPSLSYGNKPPPKHSLLFTPIPKSSSSPYHSSNPRQATQQTPYFPQKQAQENIRGHPQFPQMAYVPCEYPQSPQQQQMVYNQNPHSSVSGPNPILRPYNPSSYNPKYGHPP